MLFQHRHPGGGPPRAEPPVDRGGVGGGLGQLLLHGPGPGALLAGRVGHDHRGRGENFIFLKKTKNEGNMCTFLFKNRRVPRRKLCRFPGPGCGCTWWTVSVQSLPPFVKGRYSARAIKGKLGLRPFSPAFLQFQAKSFA